MKAAFASAVLLSTFLAGAVLADSGTAKPGGCTLVAPTAQVSDDCKALRADYHAQVSACMAARKAEAEARAPLMDNAHSNRARYLLCATETQKMMGLASR